MQPGGPNMLSLVGRGDKMKEKNHDSNPDSSFNAPTESPTPWATLLFAPHLPEFDNKHKWWSTSLVRGGRRV